MAWQVPPAGSVEGFEQRDDGPHRANVWNPGGQLAEPGPPVLLLRLMILVQTCPR